MDKQQLLEKAISEGIISDEQRAKLEALASHDIGDSEERIKPVGTLNEIFVTVGAVLLTSAVAGLFALMVKSPVISAVIAGLVAWVAAEYFHARKRFRLPVIISSLSIAHGFGTAAAIAVGWQDLDIFDNDTPFILVLVPLVIGLVTLGICAWRYVIPFLMLPISIVFTIIVTIAAKQGDNNLSYQLLLGASGLAILVCAVRFDLLDPERTKRFSDFAFWAYVVGSPLFVHSLFLGVLLRDDKDWAMSGLAWLATLVMVLIVSFAGILLNRRALILSTLVYVAFIIFRALAGLSMGSGAAIMLITVLIIGLYVTALGSRWREVRNNIMDKLPPWQWLAKLPVR